MIGARAPFVVYHKIFLDFRFHISVECPIMARYHLHPRYGFQFARGYLVLEGYQQDVGTEHDTNQCILAKKNKSLKKITKSAMRGFKRNTSDPT